MRLPLSVIVQVTRRCSLTCPFCSESEAFEDPSFEALVALKDKLRGVQRIYLSGGEPLLRHDIFDLIIEYRPAFHVLGLPTNCMLITDRVCAQLQGRIDYVNAGLDGPRHINNLVRGAYDEIIAGLTRLRNAGIEVSLSTVIMRQTLPYLQYVVQIADDLRITKVKMVLPVPRGRAKSLDPSDYPSREEVLAKFEEIKHLKTQLGWKPNVKFTFWERNTEGYALLIYPDQRVFAWPVLDQEDGVVRVGDLSREALSEIWQRYPYKQNHIDKYVGTSMYKA